MVRQKNEMKSAFSEKDIQRIYVNPGVRLAELREEYDKELKNLYKERPIPLLAKIQGNRIRISDTIILRAVPRVLRLIEKVIKTYGNNPKISDPIFILTKTEGKIDDNDLSKLRSNLVLLHTGQYKRDNRKSNSLTYRSIDIIYAPIQKDNIDFNAARLNLFWAVKAPQEFIRRLTLVLDDAKTNRFDKETMKGYKTFIDGLDALKNTPDEEGMADAVDDEVIKKQVKNLLIQFCNLFNNLEIPKDLEICEIVQPTDETVRILLTQKYLELDRVQQIPGIYEFPELLFRVRNEMDNLETKLGIQSKDVATSTKPLVYFQDFDYTPIDLSEKEIAVKLWEAAIKKERMTRLKTLKLEHVFEKKTKQVFRYTQGKNVAKGGYIKIARSGKPDLTVYDLNVAVPDSLRKVVVKHLGDDLAFVEEEIYNSSEYIKDYILKIAGLSSKFNDFPLRQRLIDGLDVGASEEELVPELYLNKKLTSNKREFSNVKRLLQDMRNGEATLILHNWQPVKKDWFPESNAPNPARLRWREYLVDVAGGICGKNKIYIKSAKGIECLDKFYVAENFDTYASFNRADLREMLSYDPELADILAANLEFEEEVKKQGYDPMSKV